MSGCLSNRERWIYVYTEDSLAAGSGTYGTKPGSPTRVFMPCDYGVTVQQRLRQPDPLVGLYSRKGSRNIGHSLSGDISGFWWPFHNSGVSKSLAQYMWEYAFSTDGTQELPSFGAEYAQGANLANQQHSGLLINTFTLSGNDEDGIITASASLLGSTEAALGAATAVPNDMEGLTEWDFPGTSFTIDAASNPTNIVGFELQRNNNATLVYQGNRNPTEYCRAMADTTFSFTVLKDSDTYHAAKRASSAGTNTYYDFELILKGNHNGSSTNTYTQVTLDMPRCHLLDVQDQWDNPTRSVITTAVLKPDTSAAELTATWTTS